MMPHGGPSAAAVDTRILGDFYVVGTEQLGGAGGFVVASGFTASLDGVPVQVAWLGPHELSARVPAGLPDGTHALTVRAPSGMRGTLRAAWITSDAAPAQLSAVISAAPAQVSVGQAIALTMTVANSGGATATAVAPAVPTLAGSGGAMLATSPAPQDIPGGQSRSYLWTYTATSAGTVTFSSSAAGTDANTGRSVACPVSFATANVQKPPSLSGALSAPAIVNLNDTFTVALTVRNGGEATATGVAPSGFSFSPPAAVQQLTGPVPASATLVGWSSKVFNWTFKAVAIPPSPSVSFSSDASGTDANSGTPLPAAAMTSTSVQIQTPAALSASLSMPVSAQPTASFTVTLHVTNSGAATATNVSPAAPVAASGSGYTGTATLTSPASPPPGPVTLPSGASQDFSWTYTANNPGIFGVAVTVSGIDATDSASRTASARGSTQIGPVVLIASGAQFPGALPTTFSYVFSYQDQIWLGPAGDGSGAVRANYDGSNPAQANFALEWDPGAIPSGYSAARNPSWSTTSPATTIGYLTCGQNVAACGPDDEGGRGLFFSGVLNGVEWLLLTGARPIGGTRFLYMTNGSFPLLPGPPVRDHFAYVSLEKLVRSSTTAATSALTFQNSLYLGSSDMGTTGSQGFTAPVLTKVVTVPSLPGGLNAVPGTDAVDLNVSVMPYIGVNGNPANPLRNTSSTAVLIDTIAAFGTAPNDALYIANNGGWFRSIKNNPGPCTSSGVCADWVLTTPSSTDYTLKTSVTPMTNKFSDFEPQDKAVPAMVAFGGRLFAARNTTLGPQLWSCNPRQNMAGATVTSGAVQCGPNDWSLVAPNSAPLDIGLTQMNSGYTAISLLATAGGYLYVGFNNTTAAGPANPNPGIALYRSAANVAPAYLTDFTGAGGCSPATLPPTPPCQGIGGNGLGQTPPPTHIFDGKALTLGGNTYLYLTAGSGGPVGVFRVAP
jgi:hypothetical protein